MQAGSSTSDRDHASRRGKAGRMTGTGWDRRRTTGFALMTLVTATLIIFGFVDAPSADPVEGIVWLAIGLAAGCLLAVVLFRFAPRRSATPASQEATSRFSVLGAVAAPVLGALFAGHSIWRSGACSGHSF